MAGQCKKAAEFGKRKWPEIWLSPQNLTGIGHGSGRFSKKQET
jgi:hypothetical protein